MKEKKDIDRLYQEKFKDFEAPPKEHVWENIKAKLEEEDEKKTAIIPLWYKLGGAAAVLILILGSVFYFKAKNSNSLSTPEIVFEIDSASLPKIAIPQFSPAFTEASKQLKNNLSENAKNSSHESRLTKDSPAKSTISATGTHQGMAGKNEEAGKPSNTAGNSGSKPVLKPSPLTSKGQLASSPEKIASKDKGNREKKAQKEPISATKNKSVVFRQEAAKKASETTKTEAQIAKAGEGIPSENTVVNKEGTQKAPISATSKTEVASGEKTSEKQENALAQLEKEKNKPKVVEKEISRLEISPFAAPIYYDNLGKGNAISTEFANNNSKSDITFSYGMRVAYAISNKVKLRSGIGKVNMSYSIDHVAYRVAEQPNAIASINYNENTRNLSLRSEAQTTSGNLDPANPGFTDVLTSSYVGSSGELNQRFGFVEIPLEIEYALIDKKIGVNLIVGASGLFLDKNTIYLEAANRQQTNLGEANNLNDLSFSTNIGFGLNYSFSESFQLNLEPVFKYQLNTFNNVENVQPYYFGVYSGFSIRF